MTTSDPTTEKVITEALKASVEDANEALDAAYREQGAEALESYTQYKSIWPNPD